MNNSGIYQILNTLNNKSYIGSAIHFNNRWINHKLLLNKNKHHSKHLQSVWNKYGENVFEFVIIECCKKEQLVEREQSWMDLVNPEYNSAPKAGSQLGFKHTNEFKKKKALSLKGNKYRLGTKGHPISKEHRKKMYLEHHSEETKAKISNSLKGKKASEETKNKLSLLHKGNKHSRKLNKWPCVDGCFCKCKECKITRSNHRNGKSSER